MTKSIGMIVLAIFLILWGINSFAAVIPAIVLGVLAIVAGILILIGR